MSKEVNVMFQKRLKELLEDRQIKYNALAQQTGIPVTTLSNYINRGSSPSITQLSILADFFEVSVDYLIGRVDDDIISYENKNVFTDKEKRLLKVFMQLDSVAQEKLIEDAESRANIVGKRM